MDPNAALATIREMTALILAGHWVDVDELAETVQGLDEWICKGGVLPKAWGRYNPRT